MRIAHSLRLNRMRYERMSDDAFISLPVMRVADIDSEWKTEIIIYKKVYFSFLEWEHRSYLTHPHEHTNNAEVEQNMR